MEDCYLEHHGIKGMRWGIRRFQNKDGSLTPAGRKRRASYDLEDRSSSNANINRKSSSKSNSSKMNHMSDDELRKAINRLQMEKQYRDLSRDLNKDRLMVSAGKKFVKASLNKVLIPAAQEAGKNIVRGCIETEAKKYLGIDINNKKK